MIRSLIVLVMCLTAVSAEAQVCVNGVCDWSSPPTQTQTLMLQPMVVASVANPVTTSFVVREPRLYEYQVTTGPEAGCGSAAAPIMVEQSCGQAAMPLVMRFQPSVMATRRGPLRSFFGFGRFRH